MKEGIEMIRVGDIPNYHSETKKEITRFIVNNFDRDILYKDYTCDFVPYLSPSIFDYSVADEITTLRNLLRYISLNKCTTYSMRYAIITDTIRKYDEFHNTNYYTNLPQDMDMVLRNPKTIVIDDVLNEDAIVHEYPFGYPVAPPNVIIEQLIQLKNKLKRI